MPKTVSIINTILHTAKLKITPPIAGAITGATPFTNMSNDKNLVNSLPLYISLAIALEMTEAAPPVTP